MTSAAQQYGRLENAEEAKKHFREAKTITARDVFLAWCDSKGMQETFRGSHKQLIRHLRKRKKEGSIGQYAAERLQNAPDQWRLLEKPMPASKSASASGRSSTDS